MVDSVFITGTAKDAFADALKSVPPWATEKTAGKISGLLIQQVKILNDLRKNAGQGGMSPEAQAAYTSELEKATRLFNKDNKEKERALKHAKEKEAADKKSLFGVKEYENKWQKWAAGLAAAAVIGKKVLEVNKQYVKTYDDMFKSGVNVLAGQNQFTDGFKALNYVVTQTGVRLEVLQEVAQKYSTAINAYGFMKFAKTLSKSTAELTTLGYSSKEAAELIGSYAESAQGYSDIRNRTEEQMSKDAIKFGANLTKLSLATGVSRDQMLANSRAVAKSADISLLYARYGKAGADKMVAFASSFPDQELGKQLVTMAADTAPALNATFNDLAKSGLGNFGMQLQTIMKDGVNEDPLVTRKRIASLMETISGSQREFIRTQALAGNASARTTEDIINNLSQVSRGLSNATAGQVDAATKTEASIAAMQTEFERKAAILQAAFSPTIEQLNLLTQSLKLLNDVAYGAIDRTNAEARSWVGAGLILAGQVAIGVALLGQAKTLMNFFGKIGKTASVAQGAAGAAGGAGGAGGAAGAAKGAAGAALRSAGGFALAAAIPMALSAGFDSILGKFGVGNNKIDNQKDQENWDRASLLEKMTSGLARGIEGTGRLMFLDNLANKAQADRIKEETAYLDKKHGEIVVPSSAPSSNISVPKEPLPSTIDSPSASPTATGADANLSSKSADTSGTPVGPGIEKPPRNADINSLMAFQNNLSQQILLGIENLVTVNKDVLKYTKIRT